MITTLSLDDGQPVGQVTGPIMTKRNHVHVEPGTERVLAIGQNETRVYGSRTLQLEAVWPTPFANPAFAEIASVAFDRPSRRLFMASGSQISAAGAPFGDYHVIDAVSGIVAGTASAGARGLPDVGWFVAAPVPAAPVAATATVQGGVVQLSWSTGTGTATSTRYIVEAGSAPGLANLATFDVGLQTGLTVPGVPPGMYYVRVRAANYTGASAPSNEIVVVVP